MCCIYLKVARFDSYFPLDLRCGRSLFWSQLCTCVYFGVSANDPNHSRLEYAHSFVFAQHQI